MDSEATYSYFKKTIKRASKQAMNAKSKADEQTLHELRVSIKRLQAFYRFLKFVDKDFPYKQLEALWHELFTYYGNIRNRQVINEIVLRWANKLGIVIQINEMTIATNDALAMMKIDEDFLIESQIKVKQAIRKINKRGVGKYLRKRLLKLRTILKLNNDERREQLHDLRKVLKTIYYNYDLLEGYKEMPHSKDFIKWMRKIMKALGAWLDINMLLQAIEDTNDTGLQLQNEADRIALKNALNTYHNKQEKHITQLCNYGKELLGFK